MDEETIEDIIERENEPHIKLLENEPHIKLLKKVGQAAAGLFIGTIAAGLVRYLDNQGGDHTYLIGASALLPIFGAGMYCLCRHYKDRPEMKKDMLIHNLIDAGSLTIGFIGNYFIV